VTNRRPPMDEDLHDEALSKGLIRYCPICDGYEVTDKKVGVIGSGSHGVAEAVFLRGFTEDITLIAPDRAHDLSDEDQARMKEFGIKCVDGPCQAVAAVDRCITIATPYGEHIFDSVYPALGSDTHTELAHQVGAEIAEDGTLPVDDHQRTNIPGLYAAGDVVLGLDQISHAMGEGGVAATTMRNDLAKEKPIIRELLKEASPR
ncbi:MAG TPA: NAD(P)/FAD-dependent oxidoreductase, partial [Allosphingosinicella sp.]|nr:NAD(P)/FAD-dependent oxidoreductase [Allosphingosinicella sp.]